MSEHPGVLKARAYLDDYRKGDVDRLAEYFSDDVVWHVAGNHPLSGDYRGQGELIGYFKKVKDQTGGTISLDAESILASDRHTALFTRVRANRGEKSMNVLLAQVLKVGPDGRWNEYWALADDQATVDAFWS